MIKELILIPVTLSQQSQSPVFMGDYYQEALTRTEVFFVENIRSARRFISACKTGRIIEEITFELLDKNTRFEAIETLFKKHQNKTIGIMSESGCPGIADPGSRAVAYAHQKGVKVTPMIGPSSILLALMGSGFSGQQFAFHGYLPIDQVPRNKSIKSLEEESHKKNQTQLFIETPYRNDKLFEALCKTLNPHTMLCIGADLSGEKEFLKTESVSYWKKHKPLIQKIPTIFLIYAGKP